MARGAMQRGHCCSPHRKKAPWPSFWAMPVKTADRQARIANRAEGHGQLSSTSGRHGAAPGVEEMLALSQPSARLRARAKRCWGASCKRSAAKRYAGWAKAKKSIQFVGLGADSRKTSRHSRKRCKSPIQVYVTALAAPADRGQPRQYGGRKPLSFTVVIDANGNIHATKLGQTDPKALKQTLDSL